MEDTDSIKQHVFTVGFVCGVVFVYTNTLGFLTGVFTGLYINHYFPANTLITRLAQFGK